MAAALGPGGSIAVAAVVAAVEVEEELFEDVAFEAAGMVLSALLASVAAGLDGFGGSMARAGITIQAPTIASTRRNLRIVTIP